MALLAEEGMLSPKPDYAVFADTQWEPNAVYENIEWLESRLSYPVIRVSNGRSLLEDVQNGLNAQGKPWLTLPVYLSDREGKEAGINWRQCTKNYKLDPIRKAVQALLGVEPRKNLSSETNVEMWLGITTDEAMRIKPSRNYWINNRYPLITDYPMNREDCLRWFSNRYPERELTRSACVGCPFRSSTSWLEIKTKEPEQFQQAVLVDKLIRSPDHNAGKMFRKQAFLHYRRIPLDEAIELDVKESQDKNHFINECEGHCGL